MPFVDFKTDVKSFSGQRDRSGRRKIEWDVKMEKETGDEFPSDRKQDGGKERHQFHFLISYSTLNYYPLTRSICYHNNDFFLTNQI